MLGGDEESSQARVGARVPGKAVDLGTKRLDRVVEPSLTREDVAARQVETGVLGCSGPRILSA